MQYVLGRGSVFVILLQFALDTVHTTTLCIQRPCLKAAVFLVDLLPICSTV